jgi:hypothetical protein
MFSTRTSLLETTRDSFSFRNLRGSQIQFLRECFKLINRAGSLMAFINRKMNRVRIGST